MDTFIDITFELHVKSGNVGSNYKATAHCSLFSFSAFLFLFSLHSLLETIHLRHFFLFTWLCILPLWKLWLQFCVNVLSFVWLLDVFKLTLHSLEERRRCFILNNWQIIFFCWCVFFLRDIWIKKWMKWNKEVNKRVWHPKLCGKKTFQNKLC